MNGLKQISSIAELIYVFRIKAHFSQQEVADHVGVARITEIRWEHGKAKPSITNLRKLADILNIPETYLEPFLDVSNKMHQPVVFGDSNK